MIGRSESPQMIIDNDAFIQKESKQESNNKQLLRSVEIMIYCIFNKTKNTKTHKMKHTTRSIIALGLLTLLSCGQATEKEATAQKPIEVIKVFENDFS